CHTDNLPAMVTEQADGRRPDSRTRTGDHYTPDVHCIPSSRLPAFHNEAGYGGQVTDTGTGQVAASKKRVPVWDNARFLCVTLVVIGHGIQRITYDDDYALIVYLFIYEFHMPAF